MESKVLLSTPQKSMKMIYEYIIYNLSARSHLFGGLGKPIAVFLQKYFYFWWTIIYYTLTPLL